MDAVSVYMYIQSTVYNRYVYIHKHRHLRGFREATWPPLTVKVSSWGIGVGGLGLRFRVEGSSSEVYGPKCPSNPYC